MQIKKRIRLDFARALSPIYVFAKQGDVDSRYVEVEPIENGKPYTIPAGVTAAFACRKPDGHQVLIDGATSESGYPKIDYENNLIILELTDQTLAAAGDAIATAVLKDQSTNKVLSTQNFILKIERSALEGASVESADEYQGYIAALNLIDEALKKSEDTVKEEEKRAESELERQLNEETRQEAEKERVEIFAGWKEQIDGITADNTENRQNISEMMPQITSNTQGITQNSQLISRNSARLTNLEQRISPSPFVTDSTVAYVKDVPANALPYAELQKLGGMTRKCTNLLNMSNFRGGSKVIIADGSASITSGNSVIYPSADLTGVLPSGTYNFSNMSGKSCHIMSTTSDFSNVVVAGQNKSFSYDGSSYLEIRYTEQTANTTVVYKAMLNAGATALPYEPYFEGLRSAPVSSVESVGANLIPFPYVNNTATLKGVTFTVNNDSSISCKGTATEAVNFWLFGDDTLENLGVKDGETLCISGSGTSTILGVYDVTAKTGYNNGQSFIVDITHKYRVRINVSANQSVDTTVYPMLNKGSTALPYAPYTKATLPIPEAVQALDGYGEGNPDDPTEYNSIQWDKKGNCSYSHKGNIVNNEWVPLSNEIVTDISALITADNLIPVQGNGTITFVNEYGYAVPSTVEYMT